MQRALVVGKAIATAKHPSMEGFRLLLMQPLGVGGRPDGDPQLVIDTMGATIGSVALITNDGKFARELLGNNRTPVRYTNLGVEDPL